MFNSHGVRIFSFQDIAEWYAQQQSDLNGQEGQQGILFVGIQEGVLIYRDNFTIPIDDSLKFLILKELVNSCGKYVSFDLLKSRIWSDHDGNEIPNSTVTKQISNLRLKLEEFGLSGVELKTQPLRVGIWIT